MASAQDSQRAPARRRILDAAVRRIASEGIDGVRIARIAMDAGVSAALVHYHFESRDALLVEALEHSYEIAGDTRVPDPDDAPASVRLAAIIDNSLPTPPGLRDDFLLWVELWLRASRQPELSEIAAALYGRLHEWAASCIQDGIDAGEFNAVDVRRTADHLLALLDGYGVRALFGDPAMPAPRAREEIWAALAPTLGLPDTPPHAATSTV
jgi:AcrR family transcriptional regulator